MFLGNGNARCHTLKPVQGFSFLSPFQRQAPPQGHTSSSYKPCAYHLRWCHNQTLHIASISATASKAIVFCAFLWPSQVFLLQKSIIFDQITVTTVQFPNHSRPSTWLNRGQITIYCVIF